MTTDFVLHDELLRLQEEDIANYPIPNEVQIQGKTDAELSQYLNDITDRIEDSSDNIADPYVFDKIRSFFKYFQSVSPRTSKRLIDIVLSAFKSEIRATEDDLKANDKETFASHRQYLELYGFLIHWLLIQIEEASSSMTAKTKKKGRDEDKSGEWGAEKKSAYDLVGHLLELKLSKIWTLTPERGTFIGLFTKPAYQLFENSANMKLPAIKSRAFKIVALCVKQYDQLFAAQTTIMQNLQYWDHTAEPMAEFLHYLITQHDFTQLTDEILREISNKEFKDATTKEVKDTPNPKTFATFLVTLASLAPKAILKNLGLLVHQLDSESYNIRMAIIDVIAGLIIHLTEQSDDNPGQKEQINGFFDILEERMLDPIAFVRSRDLQAYLRLLDLRVKFPKRRNALTSLAVRHLEDKSSIVRKYAIRVLTRLISTHPYSMYGGELDLKDWEKKLEKIKTEIEASTTEDEMTEQAVLSNITNELSHSSSEGATTSEAATEADKETNDKESQNEKGDEEEPSSVKDEEEDTEMSEAQDENEDDTENNTEKESEMADTENAENALRTADGPALEPTSEPTSKAPKTIISADKMQQLVLLRKFHTDAIKFIQQLHAAVPTICQLLSSKSKPEVLEAMDFLVMAYNYKIQAAQEGIRKMLHLIWTKDTSDEGKGVKMKLLQCYNELYFAPDAKLSRKDNINAITRNLIQLTFNTTLAELTSLEELLGVVMTENKLPPAVIEKLWAVYGFTKGSIPKAQRTGAIIILSMLAKARPEIMSEKVHLLLRIGLGQLGKADLTLARHTCIALQRLTGPKSKEKGRSLHEGTRYSMNHPMFAKLKDIIESPSKSTEWFSVTEQAINAIYSLGHHPDVLCSEIIRSKTSRVFFNENAPSMTPSSDHGDPMDVEYDTSLSQQALPFPQHPVYQNAMELSQLLFIVGHVALKQIVHLEYVEAAWKKKSKKEDDTKKDASMEDELEQVGGTAEDDIGDTITHIRERELLFGPKSLLARYGPLLTEICARNKIYTDRTLQITATLALAKFMCVSSDYCEKNLQLLFTILERSKDPVVRSNIVIALGDMAVCFNTLIDENISFLYNRLGDENSSVKKNAVMVLTHLILNGMVKVKGQISEMAKCLEDEDQRIADLAKLFFTELATKDNAIYNNLPDIISNLTNCEPKVEEESFRRIMRFIFSFEFAEKEKQAENVVDKLCQRFANTDDTRIWRDIAYCLSLLPFKSERSFRRLLEDMPYYQDKLHEEGVYKSFTEIISKGRLQKLTKPELKSAIDEFEQRIQRKTGEGKEEDEDAYEEQNPNAVAPTTRRQSTRASARNKGKATRKTKAATRTKKPPARATRKRRRAIAESDDEEDEEDEEEDGEEPQGEDSDGEGGAEDDNDEDAMEEDE